MGYEVHITRKECCHDEDKLHDISIEEWKEYVKKQTDMRMDNFAEAKLENGNILRHEADGIAVWIKSAGNEIWFTYGYGNITVKNPDNDILKKMSLIAKDFNAKVQGDDQEVYENGKQVTFIEQWKKPWWKFW